MFVFVRPLGWRKGRGGGRAPFFLFSSCICLTFLVFVAFWFEVSERVGFSEAYRVLGLGQVERGGSMAPLSRGQETSACMRKLNQREGVGWVEPGKRKKEPVSRFEQSQTREGILLF